MPDEVPQRVQGCVPVEEEVHGQPHVGGGRGGVPAPLLPTAHDTSQRGRFPKLVLNRLERN